MTQGTFTSLQLESKTESWTDCQVKSDQLFHYPKIPVKGMQQQHQTPRSRKRDRTFEHGAGSKKA